MSTQFNISPYNNGVAWKKFDIVNQNGVFYYATQDIAISASAKNPTDSVSYSVSSYSRQDDVATLNFTKSDSYGPFQRGCIVTVSNLVNATLNYTGMILDGGANGSSAWISYVNPGWNQGTTAVGAGQITAKNPEWTTGFLFAPTYSTKIASKNQAIITQLGNGYTQRMSNGVNTFQQEVSLTFQNRSSREARAVTNFVQDKMGKDSFEILLMDPMLNNQPNQKYVAATVDVNPVAYNLYDISVPVIRVFEP